MMSRIIAINQGMRAGSSLPNLQSMGDSHVGSRDRAAVALGLLRQAALASRQPKGRPFYSIRAVAKHFSLPATTVTRLYGQLKTEGVLGSIWGSKTIIEPTEIDNDIRLRAIAAIPVPRQAFSTVSSYRLFVRALQRALWRERFGSHVLFYDESSPDAFPLTDAVLEYRTDIVIWLTPSAKMSHCINWLRDRGIKSVMITDEMPINGEPGYYLSWQEAVIQGLAAWKRLGLRKAVVLKDTRVDGLRTHCLLQRCLAEAKFGYQVVDRTEVQPNQIFRLTNDSNAGLIFSSTESLIQVAQSGAAALENLFQHTRALFVHGGVDLPLVSHPCRSFDSVEFDWRAIGRQIVRDLVANRCTTGLEKQTIFKAKWRSGISATAASDSCKPICLMPR